MSHPHGTTVDASGRSLPSLALLPARPRERRLAFALVVLSCLIFAALAPFARRPLPPVPAFLPIYQSALVISDLITAVLIFGQFGILRSRALLVLASAYLFCALMAVSHALTFPGLFAPAGLLGAGPQTTAWIYFLWHGMFPLLVIAYSEIGRREHDAGVVPTRVAPAILGAVGAAFIGAGGLTLLATAGHDMLPRIMQGDSDARTKVYIAAAAWMLALIAIPVLWRRRPLSVLNLWLTVVMCVWVFDIALASVLNAGRYDAGWYAGRIYGLLAGSFVLVMLLLENSRLYAELAITRESERRHAAELDAIFNTVVDGIVTLDEQGIVESMNPASARIFGYEAAEAAGRSYKMLMPEPYFASEEARAVGAVREVVGRRKDGSTFPMELAVGEMRLGATRRFVGTVRDITRRKEIEAAVVAAREEADLANRAKSTFLATMSHEIRTPMNGVLAMIELVSLTRLDAEQRTMIEVVRESGRSLLRIIDDILDFSKIEAGKLELRPEVTSIERTIESVRGLFAGSASSKGLILKHSTDSRISAAVVVDSLRLRQILHNLVSNALKFSMSGGTVEIKAEWVERSGGRDRVRFSVKDTGIGVSPEQQRRLFQPFHQAEGGASRPHGGTGLGLTICRRLAHMMGGAIEMISSPGQGTEMILTLSLPIADPMDLVEHAPEDAPAALLAATSARRTHVPTVSQAEAEGTLVLLAEDHPINRLVLVRQINALGYAVESADNGLEALEKWKSHRFGIVITDCHMPEMDGYELARSIRSLESAGGAKRVPILACTANALQGEAAVCFAAGMDDYVAKPIELMELHRKLDQWLPIPAARCEPAEASGSPPAATGAGPAFLLDRPVLAEISNGDAAAERDILSDFRRYNLEDRHSLMNALERRDLDAVVHCAHRIKGASNTIGAARLAAVSGRLERAGRARDWSGIAANMEDFRREFELLDAHIAAVAAPAAKATRAEDS
ncbi:MAG TPA: MASE4 domain-containing protein [Usitatibacter sp.]|nr:MASE4 domain-containing protein [Usitatibacter sp.]